MSSKVRIRMRIRCTCKLNFHASEFSAPSYVGIFRAHTRRRGLPSTRMRKEEGGRKEGWMDGRRKEGGMKERMDGRRHGRKEGWKEGRKEARRIDKLCVTVQN
jgi:hypothetical protein